MEYIGAEEYEQYGLKAATPANLIAAASSLINAHCRRGTLEVASYMERLRVGEGSARVRLSYLPLAGEGLSAITRVRGRYGRNRYFRGHGREIAEVFGLPGSWIEIALTDFDVCATTGEMQFATGPLGLGFDEVEVTYKSGLEPISDAVKHACAMIVKNIVATPALNVKSSTVDSMHMEYFSDSLLDSGVRSLLAPYVAQKVG